MSRSRLLRSVLAAGAAVVTTVGILGAANPAAASHSGTGSVLSSSNGTSTIRFAGGSTLVVEHGVTGAAWSRDGSRAAYIAPDKAVNTVRYDDGQDWLTVAGAPGTGLRGNPTWSRYGERVVWAERDSISDPWRLQMVSTSGWLDSTTITPVDDGYHYTNPDFSYDLVCQRQSNSGGAPTGVPEVVRYDGSGSFTTVITDARNPAASPNGSRVAFVRAVAGINQIFTSDLSGGDVVQVTSNPTAKDNPVWSHNGTTIAFNTGSSGAVAIAPANGSGAASPTTVAGLNGVPAYQTQYPDEVMRLAGSNRFTTAIAVSAATWGTAGDDWSHAQSVVLSRSDDFADALGGSALAAAKYGPLLLTPPTSLNPNTKTEISRVLGGNTAATVYILGDVGAISQAVQNEVAAMGYNVRRLAGANRYSTSVAIANEIDPSPDYVLAATGVDFPDALTAGAAVGYFGGHAVLVLTADSTLPAATRSYLDGMVAASPDTMIFGIGGQAAAATQAYDSVPLVGANRYETAFLVGWTFFEGQWASGVATGTNWPDALAGGAMMGVLGGPLLLTAAGDTLRPETAFLLDITSPSVDTGAVFGDVSIVSSAALNQVGGWISGPAGFSTVINPRGTFLLSAGRATPPALRKTPASETRRTSEELGAAAKAAEKALSELRSR